MKYFKKKEKNSNRFYENDSIECVSRQKAVDLYFKRNKVYSHRCQKNTIKSKLFKYIVFKIQKRK